MGSLLLLPLLAMGQEEDRGTDISEGQQCYVDGRCQGFPFRSKLTPTEDDCHKFCRENEGCNWWSFGPSTLCLNFDKCGESGAPDTVKCSHCISGERLCPDRF